MRPHYVNLYHTVRNVYVPFIYVFNKNHIVYTFWNSNYIRWNYLQISLTYQYQYVRSIYQEVFARSCSKKFHWNHRKAPAMELSFSKCFRYYYKRASWHVFSCDSATFFGTAFRKNPVIDSFFISLSNEDVKFWSCHCIWLFIFGTNRLSKHCAL